MINEYFENMAGTPIGVSVAYLLSGASKVL